MDDDGEGSRASPLVRAPTPKALTLAQLGAGTGGVWTTRQARAAGLSYDAIERRVRSRQWQRPRRGVLADGGVVPDAAMRGWAAVLAAGGPARAWAAGRTTARLLGLPLIDDDDPATGACDHVHLDVAVRVERRAAQRPGLHVGRLDLSDEDVTTVAGCPSLTLARSLLGLASALSPEAMVCLLDAALHRHLLTREQLDADVALRKGRPHSAALRAASVLADPRAESPAETLARLLLRPVLPALEPQVRLRNRSGRVLARFDLGDEELRLAVETDGRRGHAGSEMATKDRFRDATARRNGWTTERCTWWELRCRGADLRWRVLQRAQELRGT